MLSLLKRKDSPAAAVASDESESVQAARTRARRRLIGAAVLLGVGIIGFPLLFETQPRPIAVDIPIEIPSRDAVPPLKPPPAKVAASAPQRPPVTEITETESVPAAAASAVAAKPGPAAASAASAAPTSPVTPAAPAAPAAVQRDAARAQALLEGRPATAAAEAAASAPKAPRYVVQAGAYTDAAALREARQKVEKLGLKTYTQVIETNGSSRTRVRVGPFESRDEADAAAARIKAAGLAVSILSL